MHLTLTANTDWYLHNFRIDLAKALRGLRHEVSLLCPPGPYVARLQAEGFTVETFTAPAHGFSLADNRRALGEITAAYRRLEPDLVHLFTPVCVLLGGIAARRLGVPHRVAALTGLGHVFTSESGRARVARPGLRWLFRRELMRPDTAVIFQNEADRDELIDAGVVNPDRCHLVRGSGVDLERFRPRGEGVGDVSAENLSPNDEMADAAVKGRERIVILFASRLLREKGLDELVEAFRTVHRERPEVALWIAGERYAPNPSSYSADEVRALGEVDGVRLLGHVEDMPELLGRVDIVALPSWREGTPKILLEAAASGLPIVATDIPGCRGLVVDGESGLLVPVRDAQALAAALARLAGHAELRADYGARGREIVAAGFSRERVIEDTVAVYDRLTGGAVTGGGG